MPVKTGPDRAATTPELSRDDEPTWTDRKATAQAARASNARQQSGRRRFVDPTTCERDYSEAEMEFMQAMQAYKARSGRMFPTWSEVLEVLRDLGYEKMPAAASNPPAAADAAKADARPARPVPVAAGRRLAATG